MDLSIVIASWQNRAMLARCLDSLDRHLAGRLEFEVLVVDNASTDGTAEWLQDYSRKRPWIRAFFNSRNVGFAAANNRGLRSSRGEFILMLNNDAWLIDDSLLKALAFLRARPDAFGCGVLLLNSDGTPGVSYGRFPSPLILTREILGRGLASLRAVTPGPRETTHLIDFPRGAFFLVRRKLLDSVGFMDERFFLYCEETDLAYRAAKMGYSIHYVPECRAMHVGEASVRNRKPALTFAVLYRSWFLYLRKHHGPWGMPWVAALLLLHLPCTSLWRRMRGRGEESRYYLAHLQGVLWALFGNPVRKMRGF